MKTIHKFRVPIHDNFSIDLYEGANVLCVQLQYNTPHIWVEVDTGKPSKKFWFIIIGTGNEIEHNSKKYIGTFQIEQFVWHLYQLI